MMTLGAFWMGVSGPKDIWSECSCTSRETKGQLPMEASCGSGQCNSKSDVHGKIMK